jgi:DNA repair exonuclease SbcCD ATPase subunit
MTKDELKKEAEDWLNKWELCNKCENKVDCISNFSYCKKVVLQSYLASAEPRERRIAELEQENKVLAQNLEDTEILNKTYEKKNKELKTDYEVLSCSVGDFGELQDRLEEEQRKNNGLSDNLTKAKEIIKDLLFFLNKFYSEDCPVSMDEAEQFLNSEVEK